MQNKGRGWVVGSDSRHSLAGLAPVSPLSSFFHASLHLSFASPFTSHACAHLHMSNICHYFWCVVLPELALCSLLFLPSSFLPQGVLLHPLLLNIPEDELHSAFPQEASWQWFCLAISYKGNEAWGQPGEQEEGVPDPCLPSPAGSQHSCKD